MGGSSKLGAVGMHRQVWMCLVDGKKTNHVGQEIFGSLE